MIDLGFGYRVAREYVSTDYSEDLAWARGLADVQPTEDYVIRETCWVILNSGFRNAVARKLWPALLEATGGFDWYLMTYERERCRVAMLAALNYPRKIDAMLEVARMVRDLGIMPILDDARRPPRLARLPFIGQITCWHLAKVLGVDCVKPDVHLTRAAAAAGFATPLELCQAIREIEPADRLTVIDSVLWRYGEQQQRRAWPSWGQLWGNGGAL